MEKDRLKYTNEVKCEVEPKVPVPYKLIGTHETLEKNLDWIVPENLSQEDSEPKSHKRGASFGRISGWVTQHSDNNI
jgi:hypothetical protein